MKEIDKYREFWGGGTGEEAACPHWRKSAAEIRKGLGSRGDLLDRYLSLALRGFAAVPLYLPALAGYDDRPDSIIVLLRDILYHRETEETRSHPLYPQVKELTGATPLGWGTDTQLSVYYALLADTWLRHAQQDYEREVAHRYRRQLGQAPAGAVRAEIIARLGGSGLLDTLDQALRAEFFPVTPLQVYRQSMRYNLIQSLLYRDAGSSRQVFQLLLEGLPKNEQ